MQISDIKKLAHSILENQNIECSNIEYKKSAVFKDKILKTICAFANNYMNDEIGLLFIGVEETDDKNTRTKAAPKRPIFGVNKFEIEILENELKSLIANIHPRVNYRIINDEIDGKHFLVVAVENCTNGPYQTSEKAEKDKNIKLKAGRYIRLARESRLPNHLEEFELLKKFSGFSFCSNLNDTATLDDLNYEYMKEYLVLTHAKKDILEMPKLEMAKSMKLINEDKRARNFAVLMFANKPNDFIPYAHVEIIKEVKGTDKMESKKFEGPVWIQAKKVVDYFKDDIFTSYTIRDNIRPEHKIIDNYPLIAFEELAVNAILHKEYDKPEYVGIYVYKDRISFVNHNRPLPPVTIQALNEDRNFDKRQYLNNELKEMFFALDLIESYGSGIRRAKDALLFNGSPALRFDSSGENDDTTNAIIEIHPEFLDAEKNTFNFESNKTQEYNNNEFIQNKILEIIKTNPNITIKEISETIKDVSFEGIRYHIKSLKKSGIIQRNGSKKFGKWDILPDKI